MEFWGREIALIFFAILFLQSGIDKIQDFAGNLSWLKEHFASSPLKDHITLLLKILTGLELAAGGMCGLAALVHLFSGSTSLAHIALTLVGVSFLALFFGQRMAKDYEGAATIASYFCAWLVTAVLFIG